MTYKKLKSRKIIKLSQNGNQKLISLLAAIYTVAATISPTLIYQEELKGLKNKQTNDIGQDKIYFVATLIR